MSNAAEGTFPAKKDLPRALTEAMMRWEGVPPISLFKDNTAAFIHDLPPDALGTPPVTATTSAFRS
jgi:hypothetical protein